MALIKCKECGHEISKGATQCPSCGAKNKRTTLLTKIVAAFFALIFLGKAINEIESNKLNTEKQKEAATEQARLSSLTPEQKAAEEKRKAEELKAQKEKELRSLGLIWSYDESPDKMGRGQIKWATVKSENLFEFDFPYKATQRATLRLRKHPKYGKDVILNIERGQFLCRLNGCAVQVRFDQGKAVAYSATEPADNNTTTIFINDYDRFLGSLRKASKVYVEAQFYQEGTRVFEFNVSNLTW